MNVGEKLTRVFLPSGRAIGRLVKRQRGSVRGAAEIWRGARKLRVSFSNHATTPAAATVNGQAQWSEDAVESVFIPVKEMLSNGPGFRSLYGTLLNGSVLFWDEPEPISTRRSRTRCWRPRLAAPTGSCT